jgi:hypothetical protein
MQTIYRAAVVAVKPTATTSKSDEIGFDSIEFDIRPRHGAAILIVVTFQGMSY